MKMDTYGKKENREFLKGHSISIQPTFFFFLFIHERERQTERQRRRHRQREKQAPYREPDVGLDPRTPGSRPGLTDVLNHGATGAAPSLLYF